METSNDQQAPPITTARQSLSIQQAENDDTDGASSSSSSSSSYHDQSSNDLTLITGAILLTADCMGTGILALPADVQTLGTGFGIAFLLCNLPINLYAGTILSHCAAFVEAKILRTDVGDAVGLDDDEGGNGESNSDGESNSGQVYANGTRKKKRRKGYSSVGEADAHNMSTATADNGNTQNEVDEQLQHEWNERGNDHPHEKHDYVTQDFVGMTSMLFDAPITQTMTEEFEDAFATTPHHHRQITFKHPFTKLVLTIYYANLFLVLGNYILVMSHAVSAMIGEDNICIPTAGVIASTLMFGLSQLNTMANLGRSVSAVSLAALLIVVVLCLYYLEDYGVETEVEEEELMEYSSYTTAEKALAKMSSLAAVGFAVGSQKLLLNIRHEMKDRRQAAPGSLSLSLSIYGGAYIIVCLMAGPNPPSFLFDAIPDGLGRRVAGLLLWVHVAVSYAINSQALCSSIDRIAGHRVRFCGLDRRHRSRWGVITAFVALSSYFVANAIPFFKDLVALCGALTSVPLTLIIPAIFYRRVQDVPLFFPTLHSKYSFLLLVFSTTFMIIGIIGAIGSISVDWENTSGPFACH